MANSKIVPYSSMIEMLGNVSKGAVLVLTSSNINAYSDYTNTEDTFLGVLNGKLKIQTYDFAKADDGKYYVKTYIPADTVDNNWDIAFYCWVPIGDEN